MQGLLLKYETSPAFYTDTRIMKTIMPLRRRTIGFSLHKTLLRVLLLLTIIIHDYLNINAVMQNFEHTLFLRSFGGCNHKDSSILGSRFRPLFLETIGLLLLEFRV